MHNCGEKTILINNAFAFKTLLPITVSNRLFVATAEDQRLSFCVWPISPNIQPPLDKNHWRGMSAPVATRTPNALEARTAAVCASADTALGARPSRQFMPSRRLRASRIGEQ